MTSAVTSTLSSAARAHLLALADDEHMIGARHTNWIGLGPFLEEDLAFCSIAQDELGHAIALYEIILDSDGDRTPNDLDTYAMLRRPEDYRSCWLAEADCSEWSDSLVRHWLYDRAEELRWEALLSSGNGRVAALAARVQREEAFHRAHAEQFMSRLAATDEAGHLIASIDRLLPMAHGQFDPVEEDRQLVADGFVARTSAGLAEEWLRCVVDDLRRWGLGEVAALGEAGSAPEGGIADQQRGRTVRSDGFVEFQRSLQRVISADPTAVW